MASNAKDGSHLTVRTGGDSYEGTSALCMKISQQPNDLFCTCKTLEMIMRSFETRQVKIVRSSYLTVQFSLWQN